MEKLEKDLLIVAAHKAFSKFGKENQMRQLQEEAAELIVAINHHFRDRDPNLEETAEEIADTCIVLNQVIIGLNINSKVIHHMNKKLHKLVQKTI